MYLYLFFYLFILFIYLFIILFIYLFILLNFVSMHSLALSNVCGQARS